MAGSSRSDSSARWRGGRARELQRTCASFLLSFTARISRCTRTLRSLPCASAHPLPGARESRCAARCGGASTRNNLGEAAMRQYLTRKHHFVASIAVALFYEAVGVKIRVWVKIYQHNIIKGQITKIGTGRRMLSTAVSNPVLHMLLPLYYPHISHQFFISVSSDPQTQCRSPGQCLWCLYA